MLSYIVLHEGRASYKGRGSMKILCGRMFDNIDFPHNLGKYYSFMFRPVQQQFRDHFSTCFN